MGKNSQPWACGAAQGKNKSPCDAAPKITRATEIGRPRRVMCVKGIFIR